MSNIGVTFGWIWWGFMMIISIFNLGFLLVVFKKYHWESVIEKIIVGAIVFTLVCTYLSIWPRIDVPKVCWFDSPLNQIFYGQAFSSVAQILWALQLTLVLYNLAKEYEEKNIQKKAYLIISLAILAECFSWTCLLTSNQIYCSSKEFIWSVLFLISVIGYGYIYLIHQRIDQQTRFGIGFKGYTIFLLCAIVAKLLQVILYFVRYMQDQKDKIEYYDFSVGFEKLFKCEKVSNDFNDWATDVIWMTPYYSICVWSSIWLSIPPNCVNYNKLQNQILLDN